MSDIPRTTGTGDRTSKSTGLGDQSLKHFQGKVIQQGSAANAQTTKPIPSNASPGKLPVIELLKRNVSIEKEVYKSSSQTIQEVSEKMESAALEYSKGVDEALKLIDNKQREQALKKAQNALSNDMKEAFDKIELSNFRTAMQDLGKASQQGFGAEIGNDLKARMADAQKLYDLIILTGCIEDKHRLEQIKTDLNNIRDAFHKSPDAALETVVLGESYGGIIGAKGDIGQSMIKIIKANEKIEKTKGLEAFKDDQEKIALIYKDLALLYSLTVIGAFLYGILSAYYNFRGENADKKLKEMLATDIKVDKQPSEVVKQPSEKQTSWLDNVDGYINNALKEAGISKEEEAAEAHKLDKFYDVLADSYMDELENDTELKAKTLIDKLAAFSNKLDFNVLKNSRPRNSFTKKVKEKIETYIKSKLETINSKSDLQAVETIVNSIPNMLISTELEEKLKVKREELL